MYYFQTNERCSIYTKRDQPTWVAGKTYLGGTQSSTDNPKPQRILRAIDYQTGADKWEIAQPGEDYSWGGAISTATGLVQANTQNWHASPMAYQFDGKEYIAFVSGGTIVAMSLPD